MSTESQRVLDHGCSPSFDVEGDPASKEWSNDVEDSPGTARVPADSGEA